MNGKKMIDKRMMLGKKAQFYILSVVILMFMVFLLIPKITDVKMPSDSAKKLFQNYQHEIPYFTNNAILHNDEMIARNYTNEFLDFASNEGTEFFMTYIFAAKDEATIFTTADSIQISTNQTITLLYNESIRLDKVKFINITMDDKRYEFELAYPSFKAVFITKKDRNKNVFIYD